MTRICFGDIIIFWSGPGHYRRDGNVWTQVAVNGPGCVYVSDPFRLA